MRRTSYIIIMKKKRIIILYLRTSFLFSEHRITWFGWLMMMTTTTRQWLLCAARRATRKKKHNRFFCWWKELLVVKKVSISEWEKDRNFGWMDIKNGRYNINPTWRHAWTHPKEGMDSLQPLWNPFEDGSKPFTVHITFGNVGRKGFAQPQALQGARVLPWELAVQVWKKSYRPIWKY